MAASPPSDVCVKNTDEEMSNVTDTDEGSPTESGREHESEDVRKTEPETEDTFKKPTLFAAPSLTSKRSSSSSSSSSSVAPSKTAETKPATENSDAETENTTTEDCSGPVDANKPAEKRQEADKKVVKDKHAAPVKHRVLPPKGPPAGKFPPLPYSEPPWGGNAPDVDYALEILKNGTIVDTVPLTHRSYFVVGRLPVCDVTLEHPSISRYHAVIQYRGQAGEGESVGEESGFYVHDLGSTHGTVVNKNKIPPKTYIRLRVGHVLKFGGSTRLFILQGPDFDEEEESDLTVTELRERARKQRAELEKRMMGEGSDDEEEEEEKEKEKEEGESNKSQSKASTEDSGCSWGMAEEACSGGRRERGKPFFNRVSRGPGSRLPERPKEGFAGLLRQRRLPVDDAMGRQLVAEVTHTGKKKEAAIQCCLEACRMLEARGLLRQEAVSRKRKKKNWEDEDYYDSDDDTFLDRTGTVEKKRQERMKKAGKIEERP
ncbi:Kanadaptin [Larimichthys crocea]|uniref:Uncharacterized protein n=1 Tax=Larimichthys crocea TaxID=215358 RepID=A0ACD3RQ47_LARCR|nr:Kanadaptin [Larimichthys crocea]